MKHVFTLSTILFITISVTAQKSFHYGYFSGNIMQSPESKVLAKDFDEGIITLTSAFPKDNVSHTIIVQKYKTTGEIEWMKKHDFEPAVTLSESLVLNNKLYVFGLLNRNLNAGDENRGGFLLVLNNNGEIEQYNEVALENTSIELAFNLVYNTATNTLFTCALVDEDAAASPIYSTVLEFSLNGELRKAKRIIKNYTEISVASKNGNILLFNDSLLFTLNPDLAIEKTEVLNGEEDELVFSIQQLSNNNLLLHTKHNSTQNSLLLWDLAENTFRRLISTYENMLNYRKVDKHLYASTKNGNLINHYLLDENLTIERQRGQLFTTGNVDFFTSTQACNGELFTAALSCNANKVMVSKSGEGWQFTQRVDATSNIIVNNEDNAIQYLSTSVLLDEKEYAFTNTGSATFSEDYFEEPEVIALDKNCTMFEMPDSLFFCVGTTAAVLPQELSLHCPLETSRNYVWNDGTTNKNNVFTQTGTYTLTASEGLCQQQKEIFVVVESEELELFGNSEYCSKETPNVTLTASYSGATIKWEPQAIEGEKYITDGEKLVTANVTSPYGCKYNATIALVDQCEPRVFVPTAFTPNGDGHNEVFAPVLSYTEEASLRILNRWGKEIYNSDQDGNNELVWDGDYLGAPVLSGVYVWEISYKDIHSADRKKEWGTFHLAR